MYIFLIVWLFILCAIHNYASGTVKKYNNDLFFVICFFTACALIIGLRSNQVGRDTHTYEEYFYQNSAYSIIDIVKGNTNIAVEKAFLICMKISSLIVNNYYFFQILVSITYTFFSAKVILKHCDDVVLGCFLFLGLDLFLLSLNIQRQMLSIMVAIYGWSLLFGNYAKGNNTLSLFRKKYFENNRFYWIKGSTLLALSVMIHKSSFVIIAALLIYLVRGDRKKIKMIFFVVAALCLSLASFMPIVSKIMPGYHNYFKNAKTIQSAGMVMVIWVFVLLLAIYILFNEKKFNNDEAIMAVYSSIYVFMNIAGLSFNYAERIGVCFIPFSIISITFFNSKIHNKEIQFALKMALECGFAFYFILSSSSSQYLYSSFI